MIIYQPQNKKLGNELVNIILNDKDFNRLVFLVAYAKKSGIEMLKKHLISFKERGGYIKTIVGVDQKITSIQAIKLLFAISDELYIYHSESFSQTFHNKLYLFYKENEKAKYIIGSSNLTNGGLFSNYELNVLLELNLKEKDDKNTFNEILDVIKKFSDTASPCCIKVDEDVISKLIQQNYLSNEEIIIRNRKSSDIDEDHEKLFGSEKFEEPQTEVVTVTEEIVDELVETNGAGFYKKLSNFDVSTTSGPGQIIIPIGFSHYFPEFTDIINTPSGGMQRDVFFNVILNTHNDQTLRVNMTRAILYIPAPDHPRPNQEIRFTFRNHDILNMLETDDILVFERTLSPDVWFNIKLLKPTSDEYNNYTKRFGEI